MDGSVDAKMIRAHENIFGLSQEVSEWCASIKFNMSPRITEDQRWPTLSVFASDYIPPVRLSVLLGDCVHNMRSALDNLICGLARTLTPAGKCGGLAFPLFKDEQEWAEKADGPLKGVPPKAKDIIRRLQPWADAISPNPLVILNKLSNLDKHRACNFTLSQNRNAAFLVHCHDGRIIEVAANKPLYLGAVQDFILPIDKHLVAGGARVQASGTLVLTFQEESAWDNIPAMAILQTCWDHIERKVIPPLKPFFEPKPESAAAPS